MPDSTYKYTNDLAGSSSPYLKQHAHNPVDWMPWCNEAFERAESENKLLFISIGYSACHWCHVMEHETFENKEAAVFINEHFISIKVDREERPDVDAVYMHAVQIMTGRGGWPLNCIALPDGRPIFGGTYFRSQPFLERLQSIISLKSTDPEKVEEYASNLAQGVAESDLISAPQGDPWHSSNKLTLKESLDSRVDEWKTSWDRKMGLTTGAPKFPLPTNIDFALHYGLVRNDQDSLSQVRLTLQSMARGGIYDAAQGAEADARLLRQPGAPERLRVRHGGQERDVARHVPGLPRGAAHVPKERPRGPRGPGAPRRGALPGPRGFTKGLRALPVV